MRLSGCAVATDALACESPLLPRQPWPARRPAGTAAGPSAARGQADARSATSWPGAGACRSGLRSSGTAPVTSSRCSHTAPGQGRGKWPPAAAPAQAQSAPDAAPASAGRAGPRALRHCSGPPHPAAPGAPCPSSAPPRPGSCPPARWRSPASASPSAGFAPAAPEPAAGPASPGQSGSPALLPPSPPSWSDQQGITPGSTVAPQVSQSLGSAVSAVVP